MKLLTKSEESQVRYRNPAIAEIMKLEPNGPPGFLPESEWKTSYHPASALYQSCRRGRPHHGRKFTTKRGSLDGVRGWVIRRTQ